MASLGNCRRLLNAVQTANRALTAHQSRAAFSNTVQPGEKLDSKVKVTLIPGDGVGPELCFAVKEVFQAMSVPVHFEELFLSEVNPNMSVSVDTVIESIKRNGISLKGILSTPFSSSSGELETLNMKIRKQLDLFANVVHIKSMDGK
jgi:isocitrate dehydrogenase (NAD+)